MFKPTFVNYFTTNKKTEPNKGCLDVSYRPVNGDNPYFPWADNPSDCVWMIPDSFFPIRNQQEET